MKARFVAALDRAIDAWDNTPELRSFVTGFGLTVAAYFLGYVHGRLAEAADARS